MQQMAQKPVQLMVSQPDVRVWNTDGIVRFGSRVVDSGRGGSIGVVNQSGDVEFGTERVCNGGGASGLGWLRVVVVGAVAYVYRDELRMLARGILAGARLAVEKWERRATPEARKMVKKEKTAVAQEEESMWDACA